MSRASCKAGLIAGSSLTDTELKVVRLVAERLSNPEIAQRLFISRRTVQTHVSHALANGQ